MNSTPAGRDRQIALALGLLALVVYLSTASLSFHSIDEFAVFSVARSVVGHGHPDADILYWTRSALGTGSVAAGGIDGHTYAIKDIAPSVLIVPLVWLGYRLSISPISASLLFSPVVTAATASLLYYVIRSWEYRQRVAVLGSLIFAFGSLAWPYAETLFTQPLAALGLLVALQGVVQSREKHSLKAAGIGGIGMGLAGLSSVPTWVLLPLYIVGLVQWDKPRAWRQWRETARLVTGFTVAAGSMALIQALYNLARFGSMLETGYQQVGVGDIRLVNLGVGMLGLLFSTPRGLIWYVPFALLIPLSLWIGMRTTHRRRFALLGGQAAIIILLYSVFEYWWAGLAWGPRYLIPIMPALTLLLVPLLDVVAGAGSALWKRLSMTAVLLLSGTTQMLASLFDLYPSDGPITRALAEITPPPSFIIRAPILTELSALPWPRQIEAIQMGLWDGTAVNSRYSDVLLVLMQLIVLGTAGVLLWWVLRGKRPTQWLAASQTALILGLAAVTLGRHPEGAYAAEGMDALVASITERDRPGDALIILLPTSIFDWIETHDSHTPDTGVSFEDPLSAPTADLLATMELAHQRIWLVSEETVGGNPANSVERWLSLHGFVGAEIWVEGYRVVPYTFSQPQTQLMDVAFEDGIVLESASVKAVRAGSDGWLNISLIWKPLSQPANNYTVFVHLLDASGALVAQHDGAPQAGYRPTSTWQVGDLIQDQRSVTLPSLPPGEYRVLVGLYDPATGRRLPLLGGSDDTIILDTLTLNER